MPAKSAAQERLMQAAAHTPGGFAGVPQAVGREFVKGDDASILNEIEYRLMALNDRLDDMAPAPRGESRADVMQRLNGLLRRLRGGETRADAEWNESKHPRAEDGKFGSGGSGARQPVDDLKDVTKKIPAIKTRAEWDATMAELKKVYEVHSEHLKSQDFKEELKSLRKQLKGFEIPSDDDKKDKEEPARSPSPEFLKEGGKSVRELLKDQPQYTPEQLKVGYLWASEDGYEKLNNYVSSGGTKSVGVAKSAKLLEDSIAKNKLSEDAILYRGVVISDEFLKKLEPGSSTKISRGFVATTPQYKTATPISHESESKSNDGQNSVVFRISAPKGTHAYDVGIGDQDERSEEILLHPDQTFKVVSRSNFKSPFNGKIITTVEVTPNSFDLDKGESRADAEWDESKHPRAEDGKFGSGSGTANKGNYSAKVAGSVAEYKSATKGKKVTASGLIQHLLKEGYHENDIYEAAMEHAGLAPDKKGYVKWYHSDLKKKGVNVPPLMKGASSEATAQVIKELKEKVASKTEAPKASSAAENVSPNSIEATFSGKVAPLKAKFKENALDAKGQKLLEKVFNAGTAYPNTILGNLDLLAVAGQDGEQPLSDFGPLKDFGAPTSDPGKKAFNELLTHVKAMKKAPPPKKTVSPDTKAAGEKIEAAIPNMLPHNKLAVEQKMQQIKDALNSDNPEKAVAEIAAFPEHGGMGKDSVNKYLESVKKDLGAEKPKAASKAKIEAAYKAIKEAPAPAALDHKTKLENAEGKKVIAHLVADTDHILGDHYAKVTAAYAGDPANSMSHEVGVATEAYASAIRAKMSDDQINALNDYQDGVYKTLNAAMNGQASHSPSSKKCLDGLREAFKHEFSVIPADTPAFRGINATIKDISGFDDEKKAIGRCFLHKNFASISRRSETSAGFAHGHTIMKFTIPAGTKAITMPGQINSERETVLNEASMWRIDKITHNEYGCKNVVHCTFIGYKVEE
jgi:hypothetical protein